MVFTELLLVIVFFNTTNCGPVNFPDSVGRDLAQQGADEIGDQGDGRIFHPHGIKKKVKKKLKRRLLQCLLSAATGRSYPQTTDAQGRTIFLNFFDINVNSNGDEPYDDSSNTGSGICGGSPLLPSLDPSNIGEGINNLGSFVGQNPLQGINNAVSGINGGSNDVKPVYENPERFLNRYVLRPLYRSLRPLYYFF